MSKRRDRQQALDEAFVRYNPERTTLLSLLGQVRAQSRSDQRAAIRGGKMVSRSAKRAAGPLDRVYSDAAARSGAAQTALNADLQKLGPVAASLVAATNSGISASAQQLQGARVQAQTELTGRRVGGLESGRQEARDIRSSAIGEQAKILDRLSENEREAGVYASGRYGALRGESADRAVTKRGQDKTAQQRAADRRSRERIAADRLDAQAGRDRWAPPATQSKVQDQIAEAVAQAKTLRETRGRDEIAELLVKGRPSQSFDHPRQKGPDGKPVKVKVPAIPKLPSAAVQAALDVVFDGYITRGTRQALHNRGIKVRPLGYRTKPRPGSSGQIQAEGPSGQMRPT